MCIHVYVDTYVHTYKNVHMYVRMCICVDICIYIYIYTRTHPYMCIRLHTNTGTLIHTYAGKRAVGLRKNMPMG